MGKFLRENWLWILAPILIVLGLFAAVLLLHLLTCVFLVGFGLFGSILALPGGAPRALRERLVREGWPPRGMPVPVRLPLPGLAWGALAVLVATGAWLYAFPGRGWDDLGAEALVGLTYKGKIALTGGAAVLLVATRRASAAAAHGLLIALLAIVAFAALLSR